MFLLKNRHNSTGLERIFNSDRSDHDCKKNLKTSPNINRNESSEMKLGSIHENEEKFKDTFMSPGKKMDNSPGVNRNKTDLEISSFQQIESLDLSSNIEPTEKLETSDMDIGFKQKQEVLMLRSSNK